MRRLLAAAACGIAAWWLSAGAATADRASLVIDAEGGMVLHAHNANDLAFPASTTKLMTLYLAFAALKAGELSLEEALKVSPRAAGQGGQSLDLNAGDTIRAGDAMLGTLVESANDAAVVLAERLGGSEDAFAARMTQTARTLGMGRSTFRNASGLNHPEQVVTARDLAVLALALMRDFPEYYPLFATRSFRHRGASYDTVNGFLVNYRGADGLKTGFTCAAGYNLVASAVREGRRLIAVVLGESSRAARANSIARLLDAAFARPAAKEAATLAALDPAANGDPMRPAEGVIDDACAGIVAVAGGPKAGRVAGYSVEVGGAFASQPRAVAMARQIQAANGAFFRRGRIVVTRAARAGKVLFRPLIAGLNPKLAIDGCNALRTRGAYCLVYNPQRLAAAMEQTALLADRTRRRRQ